MNNYEYEITMLNNLLRRITKKKEYNKYSFIRVHPLTYIHNREISNVYYTPLDIVYVKLKKTPGMLEKLLVRQEIIELLNTLQNFIGVNLKNPIEDINLKLIQVIL